MAKIIGKFNATYKLKLIGVTQIDNVVTTTAQTIIEAVGEQLDNLVKKGQLDSYEIVIQREPTKGGWLTHLLMWLTDWLKRQEPPPSYTRQQKDEDVVKRQEK